WKDDMPPSKTRTARRFVLAALAVVALAAPVAAPPPAAAAPRAGDVVPGSYIVVLAPGASVERVTKQHFLPPQALTARYSSAFSGFTATMSAATAAQLAADPDGVLDEAGELVSPFVTDPDDPSKITVWGDLAEIDNEGSTDRQALWDYWAELVRDSLELGFRGFRCDAAYKVPAPLWRYLIAEARKVDPEVEFFAETLGGPVEAIASLREAGFDYIFNSSKWWDFNETWPLEQNARFHEIAPSVAFPESHDTPRLAGETEGHEGVQRQRYAFSAGFSAGVMMPAGYEYGFRKQVNVVESMPEDWEQPSFDLTPFITRVNRLKLSRPELQGEPLLHTPWGLFGDVLLLERRTSAGRAWVLINKNPNNWFVVQLPEEARVGTRLFRICRNECPEGGEPPPDKVDLRAAEVVYVL
ncbi:MAG: hypothetical protein KY464_15940, partial [Gemmatimonadetes bacterium]|nr:hypothetical protein [Gemmatimonadota bacterium]